MISPRTSRRPSDPRALKCLPRAVWSLLLLAFIPIVASPPGAAQGGEPSFRLEPGAPVEREIVGGETHSYTVALAAGQFVNITAVQDNTWVVLTLRSPEGRVLTRVEHSPDLWAVIRVVHIAEATGNYALDVQTYEKEASGGKYVIKIEELRPAGQLEAKRVVAAETFLKAYVLDEAQQVASSRQALILYEEATRLFRELGDRAGEADALYRIGWIYRDTFSEPQKALDYFEQSLALSRALGNRGMEAQLLDFIGQTHTSFGEIEKALAYHNQALKIWRELNSISSLGFALHELGFTYMKAGEPLKALEYYEQAMGIWRATKNQGDSGRTLNNIGLLYAFLGDQEKAIDYNLQALTIQRAVNDRMGQPGTLNNIGTAYQNLGERQKALDYFNQAATLARDVGFAKYEANADMNLGEVYRSLGEPERALDYFSQALSMYRALGNRQSESQALAKIGEIYEATGERTKALDYFAQSLALARAGGNRYDEAATLSDIGDAYLQAHDARRALENYDAALTLHSTVGSPAERARILNGIGAAYEQNGEMPRAFAAYNQSLELSRATKGHEREAETLFFLARLERNQGHFERALENIEAALVLVESLRDELTDDALRTSYFATVQDYYQLHADILMRLERALPDAGFAARALQATERARARSLLELLRESNADIRQGVDPQLLERERRTRQTLSAKAAGQMRLLGGKHTPEVAAAEASEIKKLTEDLERVRGEIRARSPRYAALTQPAVLSVKELQDEILDGETLLLEYALGETRSYLWVVGRDSLASYELPKRAVIEDAARQVYEGLTARNQSGANEFDGQGQRARLLKAESAYPEAATRLSQMLLAPAARVLGTKRLLIVADGSLQYIPFGALFQPLTETAANASRYTPMIVAHEIVMLPSASTLAVLRREAAARHAGTTRASSDRIVAVLADPVFSSEDTRVPRGKSLAPVGAALTPAASPANAPRAAATEGARVSSSTKDLERSAGESGINAFARLRFSRAEAESIRDAATRAGTMEAVDFDANKRVAVSAEFGKHRIIHFATHGLINSVNPELSGIVLSLVDAEGQPQDGFLRLYDIYNLPLETDLVVLSACQTALGREVRGEGLVGLTRGFMYAGAPRVVASLWRIDDRATAELMRRFYTKMLRADNPLRPAAALHEAQVEMWRSERWRSPYYWAAFTLQGEWK